MQVFSAKDTIVPSTDEAKDAFLRYEFTYTPQVDEDCLMARLLVTDGLQLRLDTKNESEFIVGDMRLPVSHGELLAVARLIVNTIGDKYD